MPGFVPPQLASLRSKPPAGDNWLHEIKYDGYRLQIHLDKGRVTIRTRTGLDWTKRFSAIAAAFDIPVDRAIFDGEVVAVKDGRTNFSELQAALAAGRQEALTLNVFDLLFLEGFDLRDAPLIERKRILKELLDEAGVSGPILYADHLVSDGPRLFAHACKLGFEGIISKKADAPYRSERSDAWVKIKCVQRAKFPVVGFVKDPTGVAALHLGRKVGRELIYVGKVGTGWSRTVSIRIRKQLETVVSSKSKLTKPIRAPNPTWVEPKFVAEVEYRDITADAYCARAPSRVSRKHEAELPDLPRHRLGLRESSREALGPGAGMRLRCGRALQVQRDRWCRRAGRRPGDRRERAEAPLRVFYPPRPATRSDRQFYDGLRSCTRRSPSLRVVNLWRTWWKHYRSARTWRHFSPLDMKAVSLPTCLRASRTMALRC
jgi:bifunctional non-homologous end joining protein LigD